MALPTNRTTSTSIADHVADHNVLHEQHNDLEGHAEATTDVHGIADTSQLATNADVAAAVAGLVDSAPATLDTLNELAAALGDDESFATTVTTALAGKAATGHDHDVDYEAAGAVATHAADTTDVHGIADTSALALTSHTHSGTYVPLPATPPTGPTQILGLSDDDPLTTDWIDAPSGGGGGGSAIFGDGFDGVVNFDGSTTVLGLAPSSGVYTMNRDVYLASGSQVSGSAVLNAAGYKIFCNGTLTVGASATIHRDGGAAVGATGGATATGSIGGAITGSNGGTGVGARPASTPNTLGGNGGAAGTGSGGAGGASRPALAPAADRGGYRNVPQVVTGNLSRPGATPEVILGGQGGASGGGDGTNSGGGGGGGGGVLIVAAKSIVNSGTIRAAGGAGGTPAAGNCGGGGGGGGGVVFLVYDTVSGNAATAPGGTKGLKTGTGTDGSDGASGTVITVTNA